MFKFKFFCLSLLLLISNTLPQDENLMRVDNEQAKGDITLVSKKYTASLVAGTYLGVFEGAGCFLIDKVIPRTLPLNWILSHYARKALIADCQESMKEKAIEYDATIMDDSGWMASWISYVVLVAVSRYSPISEFRYLIMDRFVR